MNERDAITAARLHGVRERIAAACARAGRDPGEITLLLATKTQPAEALASVLRCGVALFGENRVQEGLAKAHRLAEIAPDGAANVRWHMIGHLQTNKIKHAVKFVDAIESVDRRRLVDRLSARLAREHRRMQVYVQVNTSGEASKYGATPEAAAGLVEAVQAAPQLDLNGLMTIGRLGASPDAARPGFAALRRLRDGFLDQGLLRPGQDALSMGMTNDFEVAIEEGATLVRVGTAVFGSRSTPDSHYWPEGSS